MACKPKFTIRLRIAALCHQATQKGAPSSFQYASNTGNPILKCPQLRAKPTYFRTVSTSPFGQDGTIRAADEYFRSSSKANVSATVAQARHSTKGISDLDGLTFYQLMEFLSHLVWEEAPHGRGARRDATTTPRHTASGCRGPRSRASKRSSPTVRYMHGRTSLMRLWDWSKIAANLAGGSLR